MEHRWHHFSFYLVCMFFKYEYFMVLWLLLKIMIILIPKVLDSFKNAKEIKKSLQRIVVLNENLRYMETLFSSEWKKKIFSNFQHRRHHFSFYLIFMFSKMNIFWFLLSFLIRLISNVLDTLKNAISNQIIVAEDFGFDWNASLYENFSSNEWK